MNFTNRVCQTLHEEHLATVMLMQRLGQLVVHHSRGAPLDAKDGAVARLLSDLATALETEIQRHFAFEEDRLFPYLGAVGNEEIGAHLTEEHKIMRPIGARVVALAREAVAKGIDAARWEEFRRSGQELCERLGAHVQKEEMALLPMLEDCMDADTDGRLVEEYLETT